MIIPFLVVGIIIASTILVCSYRAIYGPGTFNRIVAANVIGTKAIVLLIVVGYIIERPEFIDIALMYAVIAFIGTIIIAKYENEENYVSDRLISTMFLAAGAFFMIIGTAGLLRFPDFYTRLHATGKCDTLGQILIIVGCMTYEGLSFITIKLFFVSAFYLLVGPTGTHALMKAAYVSGLPVWRKGDKRM